MREAWTLLTRIYAAIAVVEDQANDDRLWFEAETLTEATLQKELRRLHAAIEGVTPDEAAMAWLAKRMEGRRDG